MFDQCQKRIRYGGCARTLATTSIVDIGSVWIRNSLSIDVDVGAGNKGKIMMGCVEDR
jgi:hypothetical protein